jgi:hypothetical protein
MPEPEVILCLVCGARCRARFDRVEDVSPGWRREIRTYRHYDGREHRVPLGPIFTELR